jgi:predicted RNA-binding Zn ribbon-like protein
MRVLDLPQGSYKVLGEHPALDLLNTVGTERGKPVERLQTIDALAKWAELLELLQPAQVDALRRTASAEHVRSDVILLRELLRSELTKPGKNSRQLAEMLGREVPSPLFVADKGALRFNADRRTPGRLLLASLALYVTDLLLCVPRERVRQCKAPDCGWFFLDQSGGRRQWCVMSGCGNAAKARRHRARHRRE